MNLDQIKEDACRQLAIIGMIEKAVTKKRIAVCSTYYTVFGTEAERQRDLKQIDQVTDRLRNYLKSLTTK